MLVQSIQTELIRLQLHPVNLGVVSEAEGVVSLSGSLMEFWKVPKTVDGNWFLNMLKALPDNHGPKATMDAFFAAHKENFSAKP